MGRRIRGKTKPTIEWENNTSFNQFKNELIDNKRFKKEAIESELGILVAYDFKSKINRRERTEQFKLEIAFDRKDVPVRLGFPKEIESIEKIRVVNDVRRNKSLKFGESIISKDSMFLKSDFDSNQIYALYLKEDDIRPKMFYMHHRFEFSKDQLGNNLIWLIGSDIDRNGVRELLK